MGAIRKDQHGARTKERELLRLVESHADDSTRLDRSVDQGLRIIGRLQTQIACNSVALRGVGSGNARIAQQGKHVTQVLVEVQRAKGIRDRGGLEAREAESVEVDVDRRVLADGGDRAADERVLAMLAQVLAHLALDVVRILEDGLERAVLGDEVCGLLGADARHTGDIVGGIALEAEEVRHLVRTHAVALLDSGRVHDRDVRHALLGGDNGGKLRRELVGVLVARDEVDAVTLLLAHARDGAEDVIALEALHAHAGDAHGLEQAADERELSREVGVHGRALGLVALEQLHTPIRAMDIPCADDDVGLEVPKHLEQHAHEAEHGVGGRAVRRGHVGTDGVERAVDQGVAVDDGNGAMGVAGVCRHCFLLVDLLPKSIPAACDTKVDSQLTHCGRCPRVDGEARTPQTASNRCARNQRRHGTGA